jgi:2-polyprenyl-6-methoxyphenol hydroxylase-like FAD-dependent oxidoreductase
MSDVAQSIDADVIVVGAGPIGLTTGCALRHHGVDCLILEQREEPKPYSRANNLWARPQELLASIGLRDALAEKAYPVFRINSVFFGKPTEPVALDDTASPFARVLYSGQDVIETTLADAYKQRGGQIRRGVRVTQVAQDAHGVTLGYTEDADGKGPTQQLRCRYVVGADGNEGTVRKSIGDDLRTDAFGGRMNRQIDARLSWRRPVDPDQLWFFYFETGFCGVMPVWGGYHRIFVLMDDEGVPDRDPTLDEMIALAREVTGDESLSLSDPIWCTHSRFKHGVAPRYAEDRIFLVGDAGHFTLPIGGQGMNAGIHDAVEVAWRLAMALGGAAGPAILSSYSGERQGEHARLDKQQAQGFRQLMYRGRAADVALQAGSRLLPNIGSLIQGTDDLQQISVRYPDSPLNGDHMGAVEKLIHRGEPRAGDRAPDATVHLAGGATGTLFGQLYNPGGQSWGWSLLAFDGAQEGPLERLTDAVRAVAAWSFIHPCVISGHPGTEAVLGATMLFDLDLYAHRAFGFDGRPALVLVRPDGHIAFRAPADRVDLLLEYCRSVFGEASAGTGAVP